MKHIRGENSFHKSIHLALSTLVCLSSFYVSHPLSPPFAFASASL